MHFDTGTTLSRTFSIFFSNLLPILAVSLLLYSPVILLGLIVGSSGDPNALIIAGGLMAILAVLVGFALSGTVVYGVFQTLRGEPFSVGGSLSQAMRRLLPIMGVSICASIATSVGTLACVIPGLVLAAMFWLSVPIVTVEGIGVFDALRRSRLLTEGHRLSVFLVMFVLGLVSFAIVMLVSLVTGFENVTLWGQVVDGVVQAIAGALQAVASGVGYFLLRSEKEGFVLDDLAAVFE